ncbi:MULTISPECIES: acetolactate decarboxylase [Methanobacterium]|jgi:acetolactate decarboxylase|uniref:Alpha-acetolactate decarboxylase n=1 Tax=Methanobacterium veterum TaxID=408577 RepID=A0A9E5A0I4_9EURY|nr:MULTISPECIES: acetolactate decarboxylase [Methanobacterium]MCZ3365776.1 acetolactate decarboxylase [Methanobacterium veterum]MCZ3371240.1 acetolactate decarboxylase [Methanobacterium veterum]
MAKKYYLFTAILMILVLGAGAVYGASPQVTNDNSIFQVSTLNSLSAGNFDGNWTIGALRTHGDTGIGTFNGLDGEMIELNDNIYQIKSNGTVYLMNDSANTPFAMTVPFKTDKILILNSSMNLTQLEQLLNATVPSKNMFYSIKVIGTFNSVKARSPPKQNKPYPDLTTALENQTIFNFNNITGTMVGFWCPQYASDVNLNDYHFHFISEDKNSGGHVIDCQLKGVLIEIDYIPEDSVLLSNGSVLNVNSSAN